MMLRVLDLFSGIGGFSLGLEATKQFKTISFCEIDPFCRKVLAKHWPNVPCFEDITKLNEEELNGLGKIDVICGGFPCQPVSCAGKRKGKEDERWLWPEFYRVVCEVKPRWVLVENVPGLLNADSGRLFAGILRDLAASGYDAEWNIVSAASVGAPHLRKRVFMVAHANDLGSLRIKNESKCEYETVERDKLVRRDGENRDVADSETAMCKFSLDTWTRRDGFTDGGQDATDPEIQGLQESKGPSWIKPGLPGSECDCVPGRGTAADGPTECRMGRTPNGLSERIHSDRLISDQVHTCTYNDKKTHPGKVLPELQPEDGTQTNGEPPGVFERVQKEEVLLSPMLRGLDDRTGRNSHETCCPEKSTTGNRNESVSVLRKNGSEIKQTSQRPSEGIGSSSALHEMPHERGSETREFPDQTETDMRDLPEGISSTRFTPTQNMFGSLFIGIGAQKRHEEVAPLNFWPDGWENDTPRITNDKKNRVDRLRSLGNAIVPQCAQFVGECVLAFEERRG